MREDDVLQAGLLGEPKIIKEVHVEQGLNHPRNPSYPLSVVRLRGVPVDPVEDVEETVAAEGEDIPGRYVLHGFVALEQDKLGSDRHGFQINRESPKDLRETTEREGKEEDEHLSNNKTTRHQHRSL
jgi:hypothetical protein